jgi:ethanolamine permease
VVPAVVGWGTIQLVDAINDGTVATADLLMQIAVFAALVSYVVMMVSHLVLRRREPAMPRPYRTPGYPVTPVVALGLALVAMSSTLFYGAGAVVVVAGAAAMMGVGLLWFALYSRHHLVAEAPEEEAARVRAAEAELDG